MFDYLFNHSADTWAGATLVFTHSWPWWLIALAFALGVFGAAVGAAHAAATGGSITEGAIIGAFTGLTVGRGLVFNAAIGAAQGLIEGWVEASKNECSSFTSNFTNALKGGLLGGLGGLGGRFLGLQNGRAAALAGGSAHTSVIRDYTTNITASTLYSGGVSSQLQ